MAHQTSSAPPARRPREPIRLDPTTFLIGFAGWSGLNATSMLLPGEVFPLNAIYSALRTLPISETLWGLILLLDCVLLVWSTLCRSTAVKAAIAIVSGTLWVFCGSELLLGALSSGDGFFSAGGAFSIFGGIGCLISAVQWVHQDAR